MNFFKQHPTYGGAVLSLLGAVLGLFIHNPELVAALVGVAGVFVGVHAVVTPVTTAAQNMTTAATQAATQTVQSLDQTIAGTVGEVTPAAQAIITSTVHDVVGAITGGK